MEPASCSHPYLLGLTFNKGPKKKKQICFEMEILEANNLKTPLHFWMYIYKYVYIYKKTHTHKHTPLSISLSLFHTHTQTHTHTQKLIGERLTRCRCYRHGGGVGRGTSPLWPPLLQNAWVFLFPVVRNRRVAQNGNGVCVCMCQRGLCGRHCFKMRNCFFFL